MPDEDIRKFWERTIGTLKQVAMEASVEPVEKSDVFTMEGRIKTQNIYRVIMTSFEKRRIRAWYVIPSGKPPSRGWPAVMVTPGYGGTLPPPIHLVQFGYATLTLYPRSQGESLKEWEIDRDTRSTYNLDHRDRYYYRGAYMDCIRGIDFLGGRPEVDSSRIGVWGFSQGGGLGLVTAALDQRVSAVVAATPWPCNFPVAVDVAIPPYAELHDYLARRPEQRAEILETLSYFDPLNLVDSLRSPTLLGGAILDEVHPLRTIMPVFERIPTVKSLVIYPDTDHEYRTDFSHHAKHWIDRYLC